MTIEKSENPVKFGNVGTVLEKGGITGVGHELSVSDDTATNAGFTGKGEPRRDQPDRPGVPGTEDVFWRIRLRYGAKNGIISMMIP